jgi:hypothetical protein
VSPRRLPRVAAPELPRVAAPELPRVAAPELPRGEPPRVSCPAGNRRASPSHTQMWSALCAAAAAVPWLWDHGLDESAYFRPVSAGQAGLSGPRPAACDG